ncbi:MAG: ABC transporter ATP-binding protein [Chloroflexi bacterium]|nr:ABC transporter ATP-binding protein [Chloroflexota bacterium]
MTYVSKPVHILCQDLFKIYKVADLEVVALRGLDFNVDQGEVVAIVGASGSGKSTLLNILAGYDTPSAGGVSVGGTDLLRMTSKEIEHYRQSQVGFVWQQTSRNLFPYLSTIDNVSLPMMLTNLPAEERRTRATDLLRLVGLEHRMAHTPEKLSGGEQQRVAIAIALANHPPLLLADEPTGELDDATAAEILDLFGVANQELGTTVLIVTHDPDIAYKVGRVVMIRDGKMSTEIRRKITFTRVSGHADSEQELDEYVLVDGSGRVQIPRELLDQLKITGRARAQIENGKVTLTPDG